MPIDDYLRNLEGVRISSKDKISNQIIPGSPFILKYDEFGKELIAKSNEIFKGTVAEINTDVLTENIDIQNINMIKRLALITTIYKNKQLQSYNLYPITPIQSENLLKENKLPNRLEYWEDLALILYRPYFNGTNLREAVKLYTSLIKYKYDIFFDHLDLKSPLLIINAGLYIAAEDPSKVTPIVLPGLTEVYSPSVFKSTNKVIDFNYGGDHGLPFLDDVIKGKRTFYLHLDHEKGLKILCK